MKISQRIFLLLSLALLALLAVESQSLFALMNAHEHMIEVRDKAIPSTNLLHEMTSNLYNVRLGLRQAALATTDDERRSAVRSIEDYSGAVQEKLDHFEREFVNGDERSGEKLTAMRKVWAAYRDMGKDMAGLLTQGKIEEARAQLTTGTQGPQLAREMLGALSDMEKYNDARVSQLTYEVDQSYRHSIWLQTAIFLTVAAILVILGGRLSIEIGRRMNHFSSCMHSVANRLDFTQRIKIVRRDELGTSAEAFNALIDKLQGNLRAVADTAHSVAESAGRLATTSHEVAQAAGLQSEAASSMAATVEQVTVSINHVADRASTTSELVVEAGRQAGTGEEVIAKVTGEINDISRVVGVAELQIHELGSQSQQIAAVVQVIKDVAEQTNLLALNAAIEAARAGEQGRGFAVVADEVRKLAERTSASTREIQQTIDHMGRSVGNTVVSMEEVVERVQAGVGHAGEANTAISRISQSSQDAVKMTGEIAEAIREQGAASNNIAVQVERIAQMSEESSSAAGHTADIARELDTLAEQMRAIIGNYTLEGHTVTV